MALKTSPDNISSDERKKVSETTKGRIDETKKNNVPECTKKSKINKKRNYYSHKKWKNDSTKTNIIFPPSELPNPMFYKEYCVNNMPISPMSYPVLDCYPQYVVTPLVYNWSSINTCNISCPIWSFPGLAASGVSTLLSTQVCPYTCSVTPVISAPVLPIAPPIVNTIFSPIGCSYVMNQTIESADSYSAPFVESFIGDPIIKASNTKEENYLDLDPIELYLALPKELFPSAKLLSVDPNPIIDEFCRQVDIQKQASWILDLEFGIPRAPVTRPLATYDVQLNSVHCKNTPGAIHPGFESCSQNFKRVVLFYYDCVVSSWYRGYMMMNADASVANFQEWLLLPMQRLGICWS